jgi:cobalt-zinc-cadmium efflux system membrane fusion protein
MISSKRFTARLTGLAGLLALLAAGCPSALAADPRPATPMVLHQGDRIVVPADSPLRQRLTVSAVGTVAEPHSISVPAVVEADPSRTVNILPPLTGRLLDLKVGLGDAVVRGQVLAVIASPDLAQANADADKAADAMALARLALDRARGVKEAGANATKDIEAAQSNLVQATAEDTRARTRLRALAGGGEVDGRSRNLVLKAPIAGAVTALNVGRGAFINDASVALLVLSNMEKVWVTAQVPENLLGSVQRGQPVEVRLNAYPDQALAGKVGFVSPVLEPDTRRAKVRIEFANADGRLKPNMFASVRLAVPERSSVAVPTSALLMNNDDTTVLVEVAPWTFVRRAVELGVEDGERVRILSGLKNGDRVVVRGGILLND